MEKERRIRLIVVAALFICISTLSIVFASFSTNLLIQPKATISADASLFKVVLSKEETKEVVGEVTPIGTAENAIISNNNGESKISNLKAKFVNPGEKVVYEFYATNIGDYDAFLNKIEYLKVAGSTNDKVCTASEGTTPSYVESACNSIRITVQVAEDDKACQTSTYSIHKLEKKHGEKVIVTIEYDKSGTRADGPFNVEFGDILLHYSTVDTETKNVPACTDFNTETVGGEPNKTKFEDLDNDGKISFGDKITLDTEPFYVINTDEENDKVKMLSEWNLNVGVESMPDSEPNVQSDRCRGYVTDSFDFYCTVKFSDDNYWAEEVWDFPSWIYSNQSTISTYLENYKVYLSNHGYNIDSITIPSYDDVVALGCSPSSYGKACKNTPAWLRKTSFWTGSGKNQMSVYHVLSDGTLGGSSCDNDGHLGIRPFITMSIPELKIS